jgi:hypothetical protein
MFAAQLRRNDMNTATFDEPRAITVDRLVIEVPRDFGFEDRRHSIGLLEFLAAGILVCLLIIAASLVLGKAPL